MTQTTDTPALLPALPAQPPDVAWPVPEWPEAAPGSDVDRVRLEALAAAAFAEPERYGETHALCLVHQGRLVLERYDDEHAAAATLPSWSMAKSMLHAACGVLVRDGRLDLHAPAPVPAWQAPDDPRREITPDQLLRMSSGLAFVEDYVDTGVSDVIEMLFGAGKADVARFAERFELVHPPGTWFDYSSGTSNVLAGIVRRLVGSGPDTRAFLERELFGPLGMRSAEPRLDDAGTWIASSFVFATARDFARFGLFYLRDGCWQGRRLLPEGWVDHGRTPSAESFGRYGAHWWLSMDGSGVFSADGYRGQYTVCVPRRDLVVVRLGGSPPEKRPDVLRSLAAIIQCFPELA